MADAREQCRDILATLNVERGWGLSAEQLQAYHAALMQCLRDPCPESRIRMVIINYHLNHAQVELLLDDTHQDYIAAWAAWIPQAIRILQHAGLAQPGDTMESSEDICQVALQALIEALPNYRYLSQFSTWAYQVIVQSVQRHFRDQRAAKRAVRPDSLEDSPAHTVPLREAEHPTSIAEAHELAGLIERILSTQSDPRLLHIFQLWAYGDKHVEEIARRMHIGPARVRVLINQIRELLQQHSDIQAWRSGGLKAPDE